MPKPFPHLLVLGVMLCMLPCAIGQEKSSPSQDVPYRLVKACIPSGILPSVACGISVDSFLDRQQIEKLICQVIRKERPVSSWIFNITIYYKLDEVFATGVSPTLEKKLNDYIIAQYAWNKDIPGVQKRLWISRDLQGKPLSPLQAYEFDHTEACK
jgi:hypothetical protein